MASPEPERRAALLDGAGMAAPWLAVGVGWLILGSGWAAILIYHALVLALRFACPDRARIRPFAGRACWRALPAAAAGPVAWVLLPHIVGEAGLTAWLARHGLSGGSLLAMAVYFAAVHPVVEQMHWRPLRGRGWPAHAAFGGYHALVLSSLLSVVWVAGIVLGLVGVSWWWGREDTGPAPGTPLAAHLLADASLATAMLLLIY